MGIHRKADPGELNEIHIFLDQAKSENILSPNVIHNWEGAIGAVTHCLAAHEKNVTYLSEHLDLVRNRMKESDLQISSATIDTYIKRVNSALSHYFLWKTDRVKWETEVSLTEKKSFGRISRGRLSLPSNLALKKPSNLTQSIPYQSKNKIQLRADSGGMFIIEFPEEFFMKDVLRVIWALAAHAKDFDYKELLNRIWSS